MPARAPPPFLDQPLDQHSTEEPEWHRHRGSGNERVGRVSTEEAAHTPRWQQTNRDKHYTRKGKAKHPVAIVIHHLGLSSRPERVVSNCNHHRHCRQNPCRHNQTQSYRVAYSAGVHETPENSPQHQRESARAHPNPHGAISEGNSEQFQKSAQRVIPSPTSPWVCISGWRQQDGLFVIMFISREQHQRHHAAGRAFGTPSATTAAWIGDRGASEHRRPGGPQARLERRRPAARHRGRAKA